MTFDSASVKRRNRGGAYSFAVESGAKRSAGVDVEIKI
jgi:hypothetical protein